MSPDPDGGGDAAPRRGASRAEPPASVEEALGRARVHARRAAAEASETLRALLDAASLAATGEPSEAHRLLGLASKLLEGLAESLAGESSEAAAPVLEAVADALDVEIARWEERAAEDGDARAVLRAFLGIREVLWEFGVRPARRRRAGPSDDPECAGTSPRATRDSAKRVRVGPRVQRVRVES